MSEFYISINNSEYDIVNCSENTINWNGVDPLVKYNDSYIEIVKQTDLGFDLRNVLGLFIQFQCWSPLEFEVSKYMKPVERGDQSKQLLSLDAWPNFFTRRRGSNRSTW